MKKFRIKTGTRIITSCLAILMIIGTAGCGKGSNTETESSTSGTSSNGTSLVSVASVDEKECTFAENTDFSIDSSISIREAVKVGEDVVILSYDSPGGSIYVKPINGGEEKKVYSNPEESGIESITGAGENIGIIESNDSKRSLKIIDKDGNEISSVSLSGLDNLTVDPFLCSYIVTNDGEVAIRADQELILLDKEGKETNRKQFTGGIMCSCLTKNGEILVLSDGSSSSEIIILDPKTGEETTKFAINTPYLNENSAQTGFGDYDFFITKDSGLYGYKIDEKTKYLICDFNASIIDGTNTDSCLVLDTEHFLSMGYSSGTVGLLITSYNKVDPSEIVDVPTITVASTISTYELQQNILDFNKTHTNVRVELIDYSEEEDAIAKFSADFAAGNAADIYDVSFGFGDISVDQAVQKGYLEDLTPYFEKDPDISEDDFVDSILNASKIDGKIYYLSTCFTVNALMAKKSEVGDKTGWTYEEMMDYIYSKDDYVYPFKERGKEEILSKFLYGSMSEFVDWEAGECYFDSDSFKSLLEYSNRGTDDEVTEFDPEMNFVNDLQEGKQLFYADEIEPTIWPLYEEFFGGDITWIGYPDTDREGYYAQLYGGIGISTTCSDKDTAWEFVKFCVSKEQEGKNYPDNIGMPTRKDVFDVYMESKTATEPYIDEFGNSAGPIDGVYGMGSIAVDIRPLTEEEAVEFRELTDNVTHIYYEDTKIWEIISDECKLYFSGDKSLEDTVDIIQNRAQTYMNESK